MSTQIQPPKGQVDDDLSPPRRRAATADHFSPPRRHDTSSRKRYPKDDNGSTHADKSSPSHRENDRYSRQESSSSTYRRSKQKLSPPTFQPVKSTRRYRAEHQEKIAERYAHWSRGLVQVQQSEDSVKDYLEQAEKPLARYRDDKDLDTMLKQKEREDDPMLKYPSDKTSDVGNRPNNSNNAPIKPRYTGPDPQTNRFNIWPDYRWDGVNRSNGFENKLFTSIANQYVQAQRAHLWDVKDI